MKVFIDRKGNRRLLPAEAHRRATAAQRAAAARHGLEVWVDARGHQRVGSAAERASFERRAAAARSVAAARRRTKRGTFVPAPDRMERRQHYTVERYRVPGRVLRQNSDYRDWIVSVIELADRVGARSDWHWRVEYSWELRCSCTEDVHRSERPGRVIFLLRPGRDGGHLVGAPGAGRGSWIVEVLEAVGQDALDRCRHCVEDGGSLLLNKQAKYVGHEPGAAAVVEDDGGDVRVLQSEDAPAPPPAGGLSVAGVALPVAWVRLRADLVRQAAT